MSNLWFLGFDPDGGNSWAGEDDAAGADSPLLIRASPARINVGQRTRLIVESIDPSHEGRQVTLTLSNPSAIAVSLTAILERDAFGSVSAAFEVTGLLNGESTEVVATING